MSNAHNSSLFPNQIIFEDNHLIVVNKLSGQLVQGDNTGDVPLVDLIKEMIRVRDCKPGAVYLGVAHRLDRPVSGICVFAKTSKALTRLNEMFRNGSISKTYWALVKNQAQPASATLKHYLVRNEKQNKSYAHLNEVKDSKEARLIYRTKAKTDQYYLLEVELLTGRHHQIRCQLAFIGCPIKGDLKYGAKRSNPDGSISLHARSIKFIHPIRQEEIILVADCPSGTIWSS